MDYADTIRFAVNDVAPEDALSPPVSTILMPPSQISRVFRVGLCRRASSAALVSSAPSRCAKGLQCSFELRPSRHGARAIAADR
jgi:hypothetical protein